MKNSKWLIIILLCMISKVNAQTVGDHLNNVKKGSPGGNFEYNSNGGSTYKYVDPKTKTFWVYFFNVDLICIAIAACPEKPIMLQGMIEQLNHDWVIIDDKHWKFYRSDGSILKASLDKVPDVGLVIYLSE